MSKYGVMENQRENLCMFLIYQMQLFFSVKNFNKIPAILNIGTGVDYTVENYYKKVSKIIYPDVKFFLTNKNPME